MGFSHDQTRLSSVQEKHDAEHHRHKHPLVSGLVNNTISPQRHEEHKARRTHTTNHEPPVRSAPRIHSRFFLRSLCLFLTYEALAKLVAAIPYFPTVGLASEAALHEITNHHSPSSSSLCRFA